MAGLGEIRVTDFQGQCPHSLPILPYLAHQFVDHAFHDPHDFGEVGDVPGKGFLRRIAEWSQAQTAVRRVLHPALPGSPGHEHWAGLCSAAAGLLTLEIDPRHSVEQVNAFVDGLQSFRIGWSWGGPVSLAVPYQARFMRELPTPYEGVLVRLCIGLESVDDLIADLGAGLARLG